MKEPLVSIITLSHNGLKDTKNFIKSILKTKYKNYELLIIDNGSKTNESEILSKIFDNKKIKFIRYDKNYGYSGGNNKAMMNLKSKFVALINNDVIVNENWLSPLIKRLEKDKNIAVVQPKILWLKNKKYFDYSGACGGFIDIFGYPFTRGRIFNTREIDNHQYDEERDIFWASGAAVIIRRGVLKKVGYFDELFFNYMEEIDLCYRILKHGYRIMSEPKSLVYHKVASTAGRNMLKKRLWEHRNNLMLIIKHYSFLKLIIIFPIRLLLEYISILYYIYIRKFDYAAGAILGQISLIFLLPNIIINRLRQSTQTKKTNQVKKLVFRGSIVLNYFFLKKRKFSELVPHF